MYSDNEINLITLSSFTALTYNAQYNLLSGLESCEPDFEKNKISLIKTLTASVYNKVRESFYSEAYRAQFLKKLEKDGIECLTYFSEGYPKELKNLPAPPIVLYLKGNRQLLYGRKFTVVGSRRTPPQSLALCKKISSQLTSKFTLVTGIADGADTAAVEGALESGKVISVLAYGFDFAYPAVNAQLLKRLYKTALAVTEYPPSVSPEPFRFPVRNRILAGLGEGTLVVSAGGKSGALITAELAEEYSKQVFAFPYNAGAAAGRGCNDLIKKGAYLTENILDIFSVFGLDFIEKQTPAMTETETAVVKIMREEHLNFLPEIAGKLGKAAYELIPVMASLEIKKVIIRLGGNRFALL